MANTTATSLDTGAGNVLVFLHGFCESKALWAAFTEPLQQHFRIIALDLPGFGHNTTNVQEYSMAAMADNVYHQLEGLGVKKCILIGHSMGGYVSMAFAGKYGHMLRGLCLFHSSALPDTEEKKESRDKTIAYVNEHGVANFINPFVEPLFYAGNRARLQTEIEMLKEIGRATPKASVTGALAAMRDRPDLTHVLAEAAFPVLFIFGKEDSAVPVDTAAPQAQLPARSLVYFMAKTGHMGMLEHPDETRKIIQKFAEIIYS